VGKNTGTTDTGHTVAAPLVAIPGDEGTRFFYEGETVPSDIDEALRDRLLKQDLIKQTTASRSKQSDED
jgi:hypothetical protein